MFNKIRFEKGFEEGRNTFHKNFKSNKKFQDHLASFKKNKYVNKYRWDKESSIINDIRYAQKIYRDKHDLMLRIYAADYAVDILMGVSVATGDIEYSIERETEKYINETDYFESHKALIDTLEMLKMFVEHCKQEPIEVAKDLMEIVKNKYNYNYSFNNNDLIVNYNKLNIIINDFTKSVEEFSELITNIEKSDQSKINRSDLKLANEIISDIEFEIKQLWR